MARRFRQAEAEDDTKVDISPLIDCVFILLIFFIVTTTFVNETGFAAETPQPAPPSPPTDEEPTTIVFQVNERGQVLHEGRAIGVNGVQPTIRESKMREESPIIVQAIGEARADLQIRVYDQARLTGATQVSLDHRNTAN